MFVVCVAYIVITTIGIIEVILTAIGILVARHRRFANIGRRRHKIVHSIVVCHAICAQ